MNKKQPAVYILGVIFVLVAWFVAYSYMKIPSDYIPVQATVKDIVDPAGRGHGILGVDFSNQKGQIVYARIDGLLIPKPPGSSVTIYYNPSNPSRAKLKPSPVDTFLAYAGSTFIALMFFAITMAAVSQYKKSRFGTK